MKTDERPIDEAARPRHTRAGAAVRLFLIAVAATFALAALMVGIPWLAVITPRWLVRRATIVALWGLLGAFVAAVPVALVVSLWAALSAARARRRRDRPAFERALRRVLLGSGALIGLVGMEAGSAIALWRGYHIPDLPTRFDDDPDRRPPGPGDPIDLAVVGESSARGEPYQPWVSVGQVVGWQLGRVFPGREVRVDILAEGGLCLEQAVLELRKLKRRPDALIVFSGHNEFQTRYGWSRNVRHYPEEGPESPLALLELGRSASSTIRLILATLDRHHGSTPAPPRVTRELVDHPTCTPREYAFLREDFHRRLDALAAYCGRVGALPILIVPPSNDGSFEPSRSVLSGATTAAARDAFARAFLAARAVEASDPEAAIAAYRRLAEQHPEFAEAHYRLARLLARAGAGAGDEARAHFIRARDLDGLPLRCPSDFREAIRLVADRRGALLVDAPERLARMSPSGVLDDRLFHDAHHMNLAGIVALARDILEQLHRRRAFGWPESAPVPSVDLEATARHFGLGAKEWAAVSERSAAFYARTAYVRHDPSERLELGGRYMQTARDLDAGRAPRPPGLPSLDLPLPVLRPAGATLGGSRPDRRGDP